MADTVPVPLDVKKVSGSVVSSRKLGEACVQGDVVYLSNNLVYKADGTDANKDDVVGILLTPGVAGDDCTYAISGAIVDLGVTLTVGQALWLSGSGTAGKMAPEADLGTADLTTFLGVCKTADQFHIHLFTSSVVQP